MFEPILPRLLPFLGQPFIEGQLGATSLLPVSTMLLPFLGQPFIEG